MKTEKIGRLVGLAHRARRVVIGSRETREGLRRGEVRLVLLAEDGSPRDRDRLTRVAAEVGVDARTCAESDRLGAWIGRGKVSALGILDRGFAEAMAIELGPAEPEVEGGERSDEIA